MRHRFSSLLALCAAAAAAAASTASAAAGELQLYSGALAPGLHLALADFESQAVMEGASAAIAGKAAAPGSSVGASATPQGLALKFKDAWYASLRMEGGAGMGALDLRPYARAARGVLALDIKVKDLAQGGLSFKVGCGKDCERQVPYLVAGRALQGKGWQPLRFAMSCFVREGDDFSAVAQPFAIEASGSGEVEVNHVRFLASGKPNAACPDYRTVSVTPDLLNESWSINWWRPRHLAKLQEAREHPDTQLVFIGDSITEGWEKEGKAVWERHYAQYRALDLGFGGDRTENVLWRLLHGEVDGIHPKVAVLMAGTNNTGHRQEDARTTAAGIKRNIDELRRRLPDTSILLLAIFPRGETPDDRLRRINEQVNAILPGLADNRHVFFLNINQAFLDRDGVLSRDIMPDLLHPNERGYAIWAREMAPQLQALLGN